MAHQRPVTSDALPDLTRAQARALRRSAPMTPEEFRAHRRIIERGSIPLATVLARVTGDTAGAQPPLRPADERP